MDMGVHDASAASAVSSVPSTPRSEFIGGVKATLPLIVGGIPFGIIFGASAIVGGLPPALPIGMSALVYAGAAQFIGLGLITKGVAVGVIILTTFVVNLRHALYAATLAPYMKRLSQRWLIPLGFTLTDETFVVAIQRYQEPDPSPYKHWYYAGSALSMYLSWQLCTLIGVLAVGLIAGGDIEKLGDLGLDFAMVVTFIGMIVPMVKDRPTLAAVVVAALASVAFKNAPSESGLLIAAVFGVVAGVIAERTSTNITQGRKDAKTQGVSE